MAGRSNKSLMERLADGAAEKRAYGFLYGNQGGGGRWGGYGGGGYGGYGGYGNPYMGGGGYGGGGYDGYGGGGGYGGVPMLGQSFAGPGGRGSSYGMDPRFAGTYQQMLQQQMGQQQQGFQQHLGQQQQGFERGTLPGLEIGLQQQQQDVEAGRQNAPAFQHAQNLEAGVLSRDMANPMNELQDPRNSPLIAQIAAQRTLMEERNKALQTQSSTGRGITQRHQEELSKLQAPIGKITGNSNALFQLYTAANQNDTNAQDMLIELGQATDRADAKKKAGERTYAISNLWRSNVQAENPEVAAAQTAIRTRQLLSGSGENKGKHGEELARQREAEATARQSFESAQTQHDALIEQHRQEQAAYTAALGKRTNAGTQRLENIAGRTGGVMGQREGTAINQTVNPVPPGNVNRPRGPAPVPVVPTAPPVPDAPTPPVNTNAPPLRPPSPPIMPPPGGPPQGPTGPRGPIKVASIVELAHSAARIHLEQRLFKQAAGLGDVVSRIQAAHAGRNAEMIGKATKNIAGLSGPSMLPRVAGSVTPKIDPMKAMGLESIPSSAAHLPVGSDILKSMGISEGQHEMMRRALGLG